MLDLATFLTVVAVSGLALSTPPMLFISRTQTHHHNSVSQVTKCQTGSPLDD